MKVLCKIIVWVLTERGIIRLYLRVLIGDTLMLSCLLHSHWVLKPGTKLKDFVSTMKSDAHMSEIAKVRVEVEDYAKQFPTIGFEKETMKYKDW